MIGIQLDNNFSPKLHGTALCKSLTLGETTEQNQAIILKMHPGESKENPTLGVGLDSYTNDEDVNFLRYAIRQNFKQDHLVINEMKINNGEIDINATY